MSLVQTFLHLTDFRSPFLRNAVPCVSLAFALQGAVAVPSILAQTERFYDLSGSLTHLAVASLSLYLPTLRAGGSLPSVLAVFTSPATAAFNWRQVVLTAAVSTWAARRTCYRQ